MISFVWVGCGVAKRIGKTTFVQQINKFNLDKNKGSLAYYPWRYGILKDSRYIYLILLEIN